MPRGDQTMTRPPEEPTVQQLIKELRLHVEELIKQMPPFEGERTLVARIGTAMARLENDRRFCEPQR
jgi:hypothetical protein